MFDMSTLVTPASPFNNQGLQQLPEPPMQDVLRLENVLNGQMEAGNNDFLSSSTQDSLVLRIEKQVTSESFDFKDLMIQKIATMDEEHHHIMSQMRSMPSISDALQGLSQSRVNEQIRTYPDVSADQGIDATIKQIKNSAKETVDALQVSSDHQHAMTKWGINSQLWMSKMSIVTAVVGQVSQGFKTLFQAG